MKDLDSENSKRSKEVGELQARVALEEQREEESRRQAFGLKQKVAESEASTEAARKEVGGVPQGPQCPVARCPTSRRLPIAPQLGTLRIEVSLAFCPIAVSPGVPTTPLLDAMSLGAPVTSLLGPLCPQRPTALIPCIPVSPPSPCC